MNGFPLAAFRRNGTYHEIPDSSDATGQASEAQPNVQVAGRQAQNRQCSAWPGFLWLSITLVINTFILATVKIYEQRGHFPAHQKHTFNITSTGLILGLGLNFFVRYYLQAS